MGPLCLWVYRPQEVIVEYVRERSMAQVVAQPRYRHIVDVLIGDVEVALLLAELLHELLGQVARANAVFEPVVHGRRENVVDAPQLLEVS